MKKTIIISLSLILVIALVGCASKTNNSATEVPAEPTAAAKDDAVSTTAEYHLITTEDAKARMDSGDPITIVDVRTQSEYDESHIPGAIVIPNETIGNSAPEELPDLNAEILVYCRSGRRSKEASDKLVALGYTKVYDMGGINSWPYETESSK